MATPPWRKEGKVVLKHPKGVEAPIFQSTLYYHSIENKITEKSLKKDLCFISTGQSTNKPISSVTIFSE
ncbi:hypothetical protein CEXT_95931 [Caerostris extrusa]|uniref:Uncharacterized protein n=1 Tax=Caerostris extrusa TaxID=172846 RepID=A0AAV4XWV1_CAEEX|nr:hypothetical protein CEXT_95931 [Caerostris extrusa]